MVGVPQLKTDYGNEVCNLRHRAAVYLCRIFDVITFPQTFNGYVLRSEFSVQFFEPFNRHGSVFIPLIVDDSQSENFVFVGFDKLLKRFNNAVGVRLLVGIKPGEKNRIQIDVVDNLGETAADVFDIVPIFRTAERFNGGVEEFFLRCVQTALFFFGRFAVVGEDNARFAGENVLIKRLQKPLSDFVCAAADAGLKFRPLFGSHLNIDSNQTVCQRGERVFVFGA